MLHVMLYTVRILLQSQDTEYMKHQRIIRSDTMHTTPTRRAAFHGGLMPVLFEK
jgi:hypothetical protein